MKGKSPTFIFILFLIYMPVKAQHDVIRFSNMDSVTGRNLGKINAITQDPNGIMWFAGNNEHCLYRYDGNSIANFKQDNNNPNSLGFKFVETVYADKQGMIWIGGQGLDKYNPRTGVFTHYKKVRTDKQGDAAILTIFKDHQGNVWIGTFQGLEKLNEKTGEMTSYVNDPSNPKSLSNNVVEVIYEDRKNQLWVGTGFPWTDPNEGGLNRMNADGSFTRFMHNSQDYRTLLNNKIRAIYEDRQENFWVGTSGNGLHKMDREKGTFERFLFDPKHPDRLSAPPAKRGHEDDDGITFISEDKSGSLWVGTYSEGLSRYDRRTQKMSRYKAGNGFPDSTSFKGFISHDGTLWVASQLSELLYRADPVAKSIHSIYTGDQPMSILAEGKKIWVTSMGGGLFQYDENLLLNRQFKHNLRDPFSIQTDSVTALFKNAGEDTIWVGTNHGVLILNTSTFKFSKLLFLKKPVLSDCYVSRILQDSKKILWIGTGGKGLIRYNFADSSIQQWLHDPGDSLSIGSNNVVTVFEDHEHNIWLGTWGGQEGTWKREGNTGKFRNYLPGKTARNFYEDHEGVFWVCTNNGLFRYNRKEDKFVDFFDSKSDINSIITSGISEDLDGNLWVSTPSSIIKINRERKDFFVMGKKYGIANQERFIGPFCRTTDNRILSGNSDGFYYFYPSELFLDMNPMTLVVTNFILDKMGSARKDSSLIKEAENGNTISLTYDQNNFGIDFLANDYSSGPIRYYTMLENYDPVWRQSGVDRIARYFNLAPGDYLFRLKSYSPDGPTGERQIKIHINPPWWETIWAYLFFGILISGSAFLLYRNHIRQLKKRQSEQIEAAIHAQEEERKRISRDLHDDIGTKLSALKLFISSLEMKAHANHNEEIVLLAQHSEQFIQEVVRDLRNMLLNLSPTVLEDFGYTNAVEGLANKINETRLIHFDLNVFGFKKRLEKDYELALYRITQELINNILKHADAKNISLQVGQRDDKIVLLIEDDGQGFDVNQKKNGYGLKNLETRTKLLGGKMIIESVPGKGTTTLIEIPYIIT